MTTASRPARADEPASALLGTLAAERATGALSTESGIVYLSAGHVVHVESALTPDLGALLTRSGAVAPDGWWEAVDRAGARRCVGRQLVDSGRLTAGALELVHLGALFDAAYFVLDHDRPALRFRPGAAHWIGAVRPVPVATVLRESRRRRDLLRRIWPEPAVDTAPLARTSRADTADLPSRRRRTLAQVDGVRTAAQIAAALAHRTFHTLVELRRLAADGLVIPALPSPVSEEARLAPASAAGPIAPTLPSAAPEADPPASASAGGPVPAALPSSSEEAQLAPAPADGPVPAVPSVSAPPAPAASPTPTPPDTDRPATAWDEPDTALLRRLLDALEAL